MTGEAQVLTKRSDVPNPSHVAHYSIVPPFHPPPFVRLARRSSVQNKANSHIADLVINVDQTRI
jgi:hypothetical protein